MEATSGNDYVRKLAYSKVNYWGGYVANLILISWYFSRAFENGVWQLSLLKTLALFVGGFGLYTFTEYFFHRFVYHEWASPLTKGHGIHHEDPKGLTGLPWYIPYPVLIGLYFLFSWLLDAPHSTGIFLGAWWLGFVCYCAVHHSIHHFNFSNPIFKSLKTHHFVHHKKEDCNFGVTTSLWDYIFRSVFTSHS
jgi:sterol desaturase/sphingolipid hydroxylase (fatty acid hydroxylase superfamily)